MPLRALDFEDCKVCLYSFKKRIFNTKKGLKKGIVGHFWALSYVKHIKPFLAFGSGTAFLFGGAA